LAEVVEAVPAASTIVLRDAPLEVLMIRRHAAASFVPNTWVFPGGVAEPLDAEIAREHDDDTTLGAMRVAAARELFEETGIWLGAPLSDADPKRRRLLAGTLTMRQLLEESPIDFARLVWTSHWITPFGVPKRFDTYFFLVSIARGIDADVHEEEAVDAVWIAPAEATSRLEMIFPTRKNLEALAGFDTAAELIASREGAVIEAIQPVMRGGKPSLT